jgi:glycosyltransferase involved in cell wall biosynthesis
MAQRSSTTGLVSIVVPTHNASGSIKACLESIVSQSYTDIEIIICDDASIDHTLDVVSGIHDPRICVLAGEMNQGPSAARNRGIRQAAGEVVFFTDDDVCADRDWILNGLRHFDDDTVVGIEGRIIYVAVDYSPQYSDRIVQNLHGAQYMTANVAYRKIALARGGLFHEDLRQFEDRDLALRLRKLGRIVFADDAVVRHQKESYTIRSFMREAEEVALQLDFERLHGETSNRVGPIAYPGHLLTILFPPLVLSKLVVNRYRSWRDLLMFSLIYPRLVWERCLIWRWALRNKSVVI